MNPFQNFQFPAPRWFRILIAVLVVAAPASKAFLQKLVGIPPNVVTNISETISFLAAVGVLLMPFLRNGQEYAAKGTKDALKELTGDSSSKEAVKTVLTTDDQTKQAVKAAIQSANN